MNEQALSAFCRFARAHVESGDIDPSYPLLKRVYAQLGLSRESALWHTLLYVTYYHLGSANLAFQSKPEPPFTRLLPDEIFPTGTERRSFRGRAGAEKARAHLRAVLDHAFTNGGSLEKWVEFVIHPGDKGGWAAVRESFQQFPHGGNWSSYKWADLLKHVHGYPITADDIGVGGGSETAGPVPGMVRVTGEDWKRCATDVALQQELHDECVLRGVPFNGLDQLETALCDFNSLCKGHYYVGHDIDDGMEKLKDPPAIWWETRALCFKPQYLGEVGGWFGVRKELRTAYRDRGEILT